MKNKVSIVTFVLCLMIILISFAMFFPQGDENAALSQMQYEAILGYDLDSHYPNSPYDVMTINNEIMSFLYGGYIREDQVETVVLQQRKLFHPMLLELNTPESHIANTQAEIAGFKEKKFKIISITHKPPIYDELNPNACVVEVTQYTNAEVNLFADYYVIKDDDGKWRILGFESSTSKGDNANAQ